MGSDNMISRRSVIAFGVAALACSGLSSLALGDESEKIESTTVQPSPDMEPDEVLSLIERDFSDTTDRINSSLDDTIAKLGSTFDEYVENFGALGEWLRKVDDETARLAERTEENVLVYYRSLVSHIDPEEDSKTFDKAADEVYDTIYDDLYDDFYDAIYEDAFDLLNDEIYDGILDEKPEKVDYGYYSKTRSTMYRGMSGARSRVYQNISNGRSAIYNLRSDMSSAFFNDVYDVDEALWWRDLGGSVE